MTVERLNKQDIVQLLRPEQVDLLSEAAKTVAFKAGETVYARRGKSGPFLHRTQRAGIPSSPWKNGGPQCAH